MDRREFLTRSASATLGLGLVKQVQAGVQPTESVISTLAPSTLPGLPGTAPLTVAGDLATQMVELIHRFLLRRTEEALVERARFWQRHYTSAGLDVEGLLKPLSSYADSCAGQIESRFPHGSSYGRQGSEPVHVTDHPTA